MKQLMKFAALYLVFMIPSIVYSQASGVLWIKTFSPASSDLDDSQIDKKALTSLDSVMQNEDIEVTFLGAADSLRWKMNGRYVHKDISNAWNVATRLRRALSLRERYGRGFVGVTDESIAGVKVIWNQKADTTSFTRVFNQIHKQNEELQGELHDLRTDMTSLKSKETPDGSSKLVVKNGLKFNWCLQAGLWTWLAGADKSIVTPSVAFSIRTGKTSLEIRGGVSPWHTSTSLGKQGESFVYAGIRYMKIEYFGFTLGAFRGWEYFTNTDSWSLRTTGIAAGIVLSYKFIEVNPALTYARINSLFENATSRIGNIITLNFNIK